MDDLALNGHFSGLVWESMGNIRFILILHVVATVCTPTKPAGNHSKPHGFDSFDHFYP
jgi:hypothetical protein